MAKNTKQDLISLTLRKEWKDYGLRASDISVNGVKLNHYVLTQNGKFVNMFSNLYHVLPNQDVIEIADRVAKKQGADFLSPLTDRGVSRRQRRRWFNTGTFGAEHSNVWSDALGTRMIANYVFPEKQDITGAGDFVQFGFSCRNGIDKMTAFSVSPMTVRMACDNVMFHLATVETHSESREASWETGRKEIVDKTEVLIAQKAKIDMAKVDFSHTGTRKLHFKGLTLDFVDEAIKRIQTSHKSLLKRYREMVDLKLAHVQALALYKQMPQVVLKDLPYLQGIYGKANGRTILEKVNILERKDPKDKLAPKQHPFVWDVFNDITNSLTFAERRAFNRNLESYRHLDKILVQA